MLVKIGRLISLYFIIIIVMQKKHYINIAFHNFKIKCAQNKTELIYLCWWGCL